MSDRILSRRRFVIGAAALAVAGSLSPARADKKKNPIRIATLDYANGKTSRCFSAGFLDDVGRSTKIQIERQFSQVSLDSQDLFEFPFVIMTGEGAFELNDTELENLRTFIRRGGFVLASAGYAYAQFRSRGFGVLGIGSGLAPPEFPDRDFVICRLVYTEARRFGGGWRTDYPLGDRNLSIRFSELTRTRVSRAGDGSPNH